MTVWLTAKTAAKYGAVSEWSVREGVKRGDLKAFAIGKGRSYRLRAADVDEWLESQSWEPAS